MVTPVLAQPVLRRLDFRNGPIGVTGVSVPSALGTLAALGASIATIATGKTCPPTTQEEHNSRDFMDGSDYSNPTPLPPNFNNRLGSWATRAASVSTELSTKTSDTLVDH